MNGTSSKIGVIFDFDDTLLPDSTTKLLDNFGINSKKFWTEDVRKLVASGFDPTLGYLKLILDNIGKGKPLGLLTNQDLRNFGKTLDSTFYPGIPQIFKDLKQQVKKQTKENIKIEFYVISGGLQEIIEGSKIIKAYFSGVYGSQLGGNSEKGVLTNIKRCVTFTEKTRYLFEISKGLGPEKTVKNPYIVNKDIPPCERRIPIQNMIYVGDGLTDIPCFSLVKGGTYKEKGGTVFGVFNPEENKSAKRAFLEFLKTSRVESMHAPRYTQKDELGALLRAAVFTRCQTILMEKEQA